MFRRPLVLASALRSADAVEQVTWCDAEPVSESDDGSQTWFSPGPFEQRHLGAVQAAGEPQGLLADSFAFALTAEVGGELLDWRSHAADASRPQTRRLQTTHFGRAASTTCFR